MHLICTRTYNCGSSTLGQIVCAACKCEKCIWCFRSLSDDDPMLKHPAFAVQLVTGEACYVLDRIYVAEDGSWPLRVMSCVLLLGHNFTHGLPSPHTILPCCRTEIKHSRQNNQEINNYLESRPPILAYMSVGCWCVPVPSFWQGLTRPPPHRNQAPFAVLHTNKYFYL